MTQRRKTKRIILSFEIPSVTDMASRKVRLEVGEVESHCCMLVSYCPDFLERKLAGREWGQVETWGFRRGTTLSVATLSTPPGRCGCHQNIDAYRIPMLSGRSMCVFIWSGHAGNTGSYVRAVIKCHFSLHMDYSEYCVPYLASWDLLLV